MFRKFLAHPVAVTSGSFFRKVLAHPVAVTSGSFLFFFSSFAVVDYNRIMDEGDWTNFSQRKSNHLGESLEQLHSKAFMETMSFDDIKMNRNRSKELFYLYERAVRKKEELQNDPVVAVGKTEAELEKLVAGDFMLFAERLCRRSMIRHHHYIKWFKAMLLDEFTKYFLLPIAGFFAVRYFKMFDSARKK